MPIKYPTEFKVKAVRRYEKGESIKELCKELNISQSTLYHWRKQYCSIQTDTRTYTPAEFDAISRRLRKVEHELEVIRLSGYIARIPLQDKLATLEHLHNLDGTKQAISVTIKSFATGLSGKLQSGDIVSVIVADYPEDGETTIPAELQYVEIISVTASTGYDANTGEAKGDEKELPSTVTFLVLPEQAKLLAELEQVAKLHLALVYRGTTDGARQFIEAQDALIEELYAEPEEDPIEEGEAADPAAATPESEVTG